MFLNYIRCIRTEEFIAILALLLIFIRTVITLTWHSKPYTSLIMWWCPILFAIEMRTRATSNLWQHLLGAKLLSTYLHILYGLEILFCIAAFLWVRIVLYDFSYAIEFLCLSELCLIIGNLQKWIGTFIT